MSSHEAPDDPGLDAHVFADYTVQVDMNRKYVEVSDSFCKVLGYSRKELIGKRFDEVTAPRTNDIAVVFELFLRNRYMHGIWILLNRSHSTRIVVRYEAWLRPDSRIECNMELLGAGAQPQIRRELTVNRIKLRRGEHVYSCESCILTALATPLVACHSLQMLTEGVWSEIRVGGECLRLFSEDCAQGVLASVYNVKAKGWIAPFEPVENIQQGKAKAEAYAKVYLKRSANLELPSLEWKSSRSI